MNGKHRDLHVLTYSVPTRRSSDLQGPLARFFRWFNDKFDRGTEKYEKGVRTTARSWKRSSVVYLLIFGIMALLFTRLPGGFLPEEDQGMMIALEIGRAHV